MKKGARARRTPRSPRLTDRLKLQLTATRLLLRPGYRYLIAESARMLSTKRINVIASISTVIFIQDTSFRRLVR